MFSAIFSAQPLLSALLVISCAVLGTAGLFLGRKLSYSRRFSWALAGASLGVALSATLTPAKDSSGYSGTCTISKDILQSVSTEQWFLNLLLFVPVSLFFILAGTSYVSAVLGAATLSLAIEFTQATIPGIGRACDSDDFIANTLGAVAVVVFLIVVSPLLGRSSRDNLFKVTGGRRGATMQAASIAIVAVTGFATLTMNYVTSSTPIREASSDQYRAASHALEALAGHNINVTRTQISEFSNDYGENGRALIASWKGGNAEISWPDKKIRNLWSSKGVILQGYKSKPQSSNSSTAKALAVEFVYKNFPWAAVATDISVSPDSDFPGAWRVTFKEKRNGITMPLRLSVTFSKDSRLMQLTADDTPAPNVVPPAKVPLSAASKTAALQAPPNSKLSTTELRLYKDGASWVTVWDFSYTRQSGANKQYSPASVLVNATTGDLLSAGGSEVSVSVS